ncbi:hypothetical protein PV735_32100 [Streptomyces turgidiscabies]|uniref:Uncharacterized protein n=1 Tax=Streptomyces turgidiscabies (strain Car8) TaxID=698760 RepID=L7ESX9_STRT8|nr:MULTISPECIES: hypothetical protein [Streptomyces]ELP61495.1 hypothetical protein STRTUCAR8_03638 [Streptomyces turgidiscabies Car8]MDX3497295.1 hypothetical protein [Streptomyces turgidiscabies]GAQ68607.1 hypothetical protein T45_00318 [Streptomyces turgidiscabies]
MPVSGRLVSLAAQSMLATATTRSCGYGTAPTASSTPTGAVIPYSVLYPLGITTSGPAYGDADADARVLFQVTCVASTAEQAEWMADKVRAAVLGRTAKGEFVTAIAIAGCAVIGRELDKEEGVTVSGGVYSYVQRYVLTVTTLGS